MSSFPLRNRDLIPSRRMQGEAPKGEASRAVPQGRGSKCFQVHLWREAFGHLLLWPLGSKPELTRKAIEMVDFWILKNDLL